MSTRYVWDVYEKIKYKQRTEINSYSTLVTGSYETGYRNIVYAKEIEEDVENGTITLKGLNWNTSVSAYEYPYAAKPGLYKYPNDEASPSTVTVSQVFFYKEATAGYGYWIISLAGSGSNRQFDLSLRETASSSAKSIRFGKIEYNDATKKGELLSRVTSNSSTAYPNDDVSISTKDTTKWYSYLGSDEPDPNSVTGPSTAHYGETVTYTINPSYPTFGGTLYYQWRVAYNDSFSETLGNKTTNTTLSQTLTTNRDYTRVCYSVKVSDNTGYESKNVYGQTTQLGEEAPPIPIDEPKSFYVGINGVAREIEKLYVGVNGVAKEVEHLYVGVDGIARKIF